VTSIFVTHDQEEALEVADRVVVIHHGRIEQQGTPQEVWEHPATPFVYDFLGEVNRFAARDGQIRLTPDPDANEASSFAYVRPHELDVARHPAGDSTADMRLQLQRAVVVGALARLELVPLAGLDPVHSTPDSTAPERVIEAQIPVQQFHSMGLRPGETLVVSPRRAKVFLESEAMG